MSHNPWPSTLANTQVNTQAASTTPQTPESVTSEPVVDQNTPPGIVDPDPNPPLGPDGEPLTLLEYKEEDIVAKRKYHENDKRYSGHGGTQDALKAFIVWMSKLTAEQQKQFKKPSYVHDAERTLGFIKTLQVGDVIGVESHMWKILDTKNPKKLKAVRRVISGNKASFPDEKVEDLTIQMVDMAFNKNCCEILYRNDTPYGMDEELSYKVRLKVYADKKGRTYVFKSGKEILPPSAENASATSEKESK